MQAKYKALVTGATGYIGGRLVQKLIQNNWQVHALVRSRSSKDFPSSVAAHIYEGTFERMQSIVSEVKPDVVFHLAALVLAEHKTKDIDLLIQSNIQLGCHLFEAMTVAGIERIVHTGTFSQYDENGEYGPANLYSATKEASQNILQFYTEHFAIKAITLMLFDVYGPGDPRRKLFALLEKAFRSGDELPMTPGNQKLDMIHVDDVIHAFLRAAELLFSEKYNSRFSVFSAGTGRLLTLREIVELYEKVMDRKINIKFGKIPYRKRQIMTPWAGTPLPGWKAKISLESGLSMLAKPLNEKVGV